MSPVIKVSDLHALFSTAYVTHNGLEKSLSSALLPLGQPYAVRKIGFVYPRRMSHLLIIP